MVEGITDAVFFSSLLRRYLSDVRIEPMPQRRGIPASAEGTRSDGSILELEFRNQAPERGEGVGRIPDAIGALIRGGNVTQLAVARDLDENSREEVVDSIRGTVVNLLGGPLENISPGKFRVQNSRVQQVSTGQWITVGVIPMGEPEDPDLQALDITHHAMEDYLVRMLLKDSRLPDGTRLLEELVGTIRGYGVTFDSTKELFQLVKPIVKLGYSDTGVVEALFENTAPNTLRSVIDPVFHRLESAVAPYIYIK